MLAIAFDPNLPLVATSAFPDGTVAAGEVFDWRSRGVPEIDVFALVRSGLLAHPAPPQTPPAPAVEPKKRR